VTLAYAYEIVENHYGDRKTKRSGQRLMRHIDEGLVILEHIGADEGTKAAYCLHPLVQENRDLEANWLWLALDVKDPLVLVLTMEYRNIANAFLSPMEEHKGYEDFRKIAISPLYQVNQMLVADKIQNRMDFLTYHKGIHPRSDWLDAYFEAWMKALEISDERYEQFTAGLPGRLAKDALRKSRSGGPP